MSVAETANLFMCMKTLVFKEIFLRNLINGVEISITVYLTQYKLILNLVTLLNTSICPRRPTPA